MSYDHPCADDAGLEEIACPACSQETFDPTEKLCDNALCRYAETCNECGIEIDVADYDPEHQSFCSTRCHGEAIAARWATA